MRFKNSLVTVAVCAIAALGLVVGGAFAARYANLDVDVLQVLESAHIKSLQVGGDPATNTAGTTLNATESAFIDGVTAGTGLASKAIVVDANQAVTDVGNLTIHQKSTAGTASHTGGNGNAIQKYVGVPKLSPFAVGASIDGTAQVIAGTTFIDETPAGEWVGTTNVTDGTETTIFRKGTGSLSLTVAAAAVAGNGADNTLAGGDQDWSADESVGVWVYSTVALTAGDLVLEISDSGPVVTTVNFPAVATANQWTWCEIDISGVADASKDVIESIAIDLSTAGAALGAFTAYFDGMAKWDGANEEALGLDVYEDGVIAVFAQATAAGSANTVSVLADQTDYIIHYEAGNDFFIAVTNQSAASIFGLAALE